MRLRLPGLQLELFPLLADVFYHGHGLVFVLLLRVDLHQQARRFLEGLGHVVASLGADLEVPNSSLLAHLLNLFGRHAGLRQVALVAQQNQLHVGHGVLVDLTGICCTSLNQ